MVKIAHTSIANKNKRGFPLLSLIQRLLKSICNRSFIFGILVGLILILAISSRDDITRIEEELPLTSSSSSSSTTTKGSRSSSSSSGKTRTSSTNSVIRHGDISCEEIFESRRRRKKGGSTKEDAVEGGGGKAPAASRRSDIDWYSIDPNKGRLYAREIVTPPVPFVIALHNSEYDSVRWKTIMDTGQYYEQHVHDNFVQVLVSGNNSSKATTTGRNTNTRNSYVIDVGANIGYYTLLSASLHANVIAFEPNPSNIVRICESIRLNSHNNNGNDDGDFRNRDIRIFQNAVGESELHNTEMLLYVPKNPGQGFLKELPSITTTAEKAGNSPFLHHDVDETIINDEHHSKTKVISLDKWAEEHHLFDAAKAGDFSIEILKVDVEGHEPQVLLGAKKLLQSGIVKHVFTECRRFGRDNVKDMIVTLLEAGFVLRRPNCNMCMKSTASPQEKANSFTDWATIVIGKHKGKTMDLWWEKVK